MEQNINDKFSNINTFNIINSHNPTPLYIPPAQKTNPVTNQNTATSSTSTTNSVKNLYKYYQYFLDKSVPHLIIRWVFTVCLYILFGIRIVMSNGWYIVAYALGIYILNLLIAFLSPKIDPSSGRTSLYGYDDDLYGGFYQEDLSYYDNQSSLPTKSDDEFRPFIRRLPEFKFWQSATHAVLISLFCTLFEAFDVPVFWPILVMYWIILFILTMKRQIAHMIRYRYLPFTHGKKTYSASKAQNR